MNLLESTGMGPVRMMQAAALEVDVKLCGSAQPSADHLALAVDEVFEGLGADPRARGWLPRSGLAVWLKGAL
ncbi:MAG: hypothetical protein CL862_14240 [Cyanobium sp. NAT70]|nr:hypothetical protein [Cyanobium sp. NAT70]